MTEKQKKTLVLFAQNYSLQVIAKKQKVSFSTIRERIRALSKNHQKEFNNALVLREVYKRTRSALRNTTSFSVLFNRSNLKEINTTLSTDEIMEIVKEVF